MPLFSFPPQMLRPDAERLELVQPRLIRLLYLVLGAVLLVVLVRAMEGFSWLSFMFALVIGLAVLQEDRWSFDMRKREIRRRSGFIFFHRSWALDLSELTSVELLGDASQLSSDDPQYRALAGTGKGRSALGLVLADGRNLTLYVLPAARKEALAERGKAIAELCGLPYVES
ncbi:MAG TPA: hypothetical protein PK625_05990 [Spirochaetales bacterium]|nr:hypothetical protein [Spirochaetales bacterium]